MSMSLVESVKKILGRELTIEEVSNLSNFQKYHEVDDSDPLVVVLALVGANTVLINSLPNLLQQKANETIELHRRTLMEQSTIIAKDLITTIAHNIIVEHWKKQLITYGAIFVGGAISAIVFLRVFGH